LKLLRLSNNDFRNAAPLLSSRRGRSAPMNDRGAISPAEE
jgi:hypothetical protein